MNRVPSLASRKRAERKTAEQIGRDMMALLGPGWTLHIQGRSLGPGRNFNHEAQNCDLLFWFVKAVSSCGVWEVHPWKIEDILYIVAQVPYESENPSRTASGRTPAEAFSKLRRRLAEEVRAATAVLEDRQQTLNTLPTCSPTSGLKKRKARRGTGT